MAEESVQLSNSLWIIIITETYVKITATITSKYCRVFTDIFPTWFVLSKCLVVLSGVVGICYCSSHRMVLRGLR